MFQNPIGIAIDPSATFALVVDSQARRIFQIQIANAQVTILAGSGQSSSSNVDGAGTGATFNNPFGVAIHPSMNYALVSDLGSGLIRRIDVISRQVSTLAGGGSLLNGVGTQAMVQLLLCIRMLEHLASSIAVLFLHFQLVDLLCLVSTQLATPYGIAIDPTGCFAFVIGTSQGARIQRVDLASFSVTVIAGGSSRGNFDSVGTLATFDVRSYHF